MNQHIFKTFTHTKEQIWKVIMGSQKICFLSIFLFLNETYIFGYEFNLCENLGKIIKKDMKYANLQ